MIAIVIGMHRSGTSALAGLLHNHNIIMGDDNTFIPKPSPENLKGFYENLSFRNINDQIAEKNGYGIKSWATDIPSMKANIYLRYKMRRLLKQYNKKYDTWGWKDPRTCLTLGIWVKELEKLGLLEQCRFLFIVRDPSTVAASMVKRKNASFVDCIKLWIEYNQYTLSAIDKYNLITHYLTYENLVDNPLTASQNIFSFLSIPIDKNIVNKFIDSKLNRTQIKEMTNSIPANLKQDVEKIKKRLNLELI